MLDALDGAIEMMSVLEAPSNVGSGHNRERRARIDIAALLFDIAPDAKLSIEPGAGTEVFGVEQELRRMLDLLIKQSGAGGGAPTVIGVHREADWVVVTIGLGPEGMSTRALEHRWLNRMALRHGGRVELAGNETRLYVPADTESGQQEIRQLRKELEQAQQLGAVYAKELAEAFTQGTTDSVPPGPSVIPFAATESRLQILISCASALSRTLRQIAEQIRSDLSRLARSMGEQHEIVSLLQARQRALGEIVTDLDRIARTNVDEPRLPVDLGVVIREVANSVAGRVQRLELTISLDAEESLVIHAKTSLVALLVRAALDQAIYASPQRSQIGIQLRSDAIQGKKRYKLEITDLGPRIPEAALPSLLLGAADPSSIGRPSALSWLVLGTVATALEVGVSAGEHETQHIAALWLAFD
jgi:cell fate (sporulation/competence/biofilm development) regulator YlbF (YheA/YmcA/DUF963 family)